MKNFSSYAKRCLSFVLVLGMLLSNMTGLALLASAATEESFTYGEIVADNYDALTDAERDLLTSGLLAGGSYIFELPDESDDLVSIDTESKTITAEDFDGWIATEAHIRVGDVVQETVAMSDGTGTYTYDGNAFSAQVWYALRTEVDADLQTTLMSTAGWLQQGVANLDGVSAQKDSLTALETAMPELVSFAASGGVTTKYGTVEFSSTTIESINTLNAQMTANGGKVNMSVMIEDYKSGSKTEYLMNEGAALKTELASTTAHITNISEPVNTIITLSSSISNLVDPATVSLLKALSTELAKWTNDKGTGAADVALKADWTAADKGTALVKAEITAEEYADLDALVAALGDTLTGAPATVSNPLLVAETMIQKNLSMYNVTANLVLMVVEDEVGSTDLVEYDSQEYVVTLNKDATAEEIRAALEEFVTDIENEWGRSYDMDSFTSEESDLPATLTEDITYTITYSPVAYTVTYTGFDGLTEEDFPYGYQLLLPVHEDEAKSYDYTVDGGSYAQGEVITIVADTAISRVAGKAYTVGDLMTIVANNYGTAKEQAILSSGALLDNPAVNVRYPDRNDDLVSVKDGVLTAKPYASSYKDLEWMPYTYEVDGTSYNFAEGETTATITKLDYQSITVTYRLTLTNIDNTQSYLDLAEKLSKDAAQQQSALASLSSQSVSDNMNMLNGTMLNFLKSLIADNALHEDAAKNEQLKALFTDVVDKIKANCLNSDSNLTLADLVNAYNDSGKDLGYYYKNSDAFIEEVGLFSGYLNELLAADANFTAEEKIAAMTVLIGKAPSNIVSDPVKYTEKLTTLQTDMDTIRQNLVAPDASIDVGSENLSDLTAALTMSGKVGSTATGYPFLAKGDFNLAGSGKVYLTVTVICGDAEGVVSTLYDLDQELTQSDIDVLLSKIDAKLAELGIDTKLYKSEDYNAGAALKALIGTKITEKMSFAYTWVAKTACEINGHTEEIVKGHAATCTATGLTDGVKCSVCGEILTAQEVIPVADHTKETIKGTPATCTTTGLTDGVKCSVCHEILTKQEVIPVADHTKETIKGTPATCTTTGLTDGVKCSVCHTILTKQEVIPALEHDFTGEYVKDATGHWHVCAREGCDATDGLVAHTYDTDDCTKEAHCTVCTYTKKAGDHSWGEWITDENTHKHICSSCGAEESAEHTKVTIPGTPATCTATGWTDGVKCSVCQTILTAQEVIPMKEHTKETIPGTPATCKQTGLTDGVKCSVCHEILTKQEVIPVVDHKFDGAYVYDATHHWHVCSFQCGTIDEKIEHTWDEGVVANGVKTYTCECGATKTVEVGKLELGEAVNVPFVVNNNKITLPAPSDDGYEGGYRYDYEIKGTGTATRKVTNTNGSGTYPLSVNEQADYAAGKLTVTKKLVNLNNEKFAALVTAMDTGVTVTTDASKTITQDGYYTGITAKVGLGGMMDVVMALVMNSGYSKVSLGGEQLLDADGKISLVGLIRVLMGEDGTYSSKELINLGNGTDTTLLDTKLGLGEVPVAVAASDDTAANAEYHLVDFVLELTAVPAQLTSLTGMLDMVKGYVTFDVVDGDRQNSDIDINIKVNLPEKVYEIYVAALRLTGNLDENDVNAVEEAVAYEFLKDYLDVLLGKDVTATTLANTAKKLGKTVEIKEIYQKIFGAVQGKLDYGKGVVYDANGASALLTATNVEISNLLDAAETVLATGMMDTIKSLVVECEGYKTATDDGTVTVKVGLNAAMGNHTDDNGDGYIDTDYEAIVIDAAALNNSALLDKAGVFDLTNDLAASVKGLTGFSAIMLQKDVTVNDGLTFNSATVLDLNGHTLTADITAKATLIIIDSTLDTLSCGSVNGTISGSEVTVLAGKYTSDVSAFLKSGYVQENGTVHSELYTISVDANGNITFNVNSEILNMTAAPSVKALGIDMALDLAMNFFTTASLKLAGNSIYAVDIENLIEVYNAKDVNAVLDLIDMKGIETFVNAIIADCLDYTAINTAVNGDGVILTYTMTTAPWQITLNRDAAGDYLVPGVAAGEEETVNVNVKIDGDNMDEVKALTAALAEAVTAEATITLTDPMTYANKIIGVQASGKANVVVDWTVNENYPTVVGVILAYGNNSLKTAIVDALNKGDKEALKAAVETATVAQAIAAIKAVNRTTDFAAMAEAVGVTVETADAAALEAAYHNVLAIGGALINKFGFAGNNIKLGDLESDTYGVYVADKENLNKNGTAAIAKGFSVAYDVTVTDVSVTVKLFELCEHAYGEPVFVWAEDYKSATASITCTKNCGTVISDNCVITTKTTDATCVVKGTVTYTATVTLNGTEYTDTKVVEGAYGEHVWGEWTKVNSKTHKRVCTYNDQHVQTEEHNFVDRVCTDCGYKKSSTIIIPGGTGNTKPSVTTKCKCHQFTDIDLKAWYHEYVCYAIQNELMYGTGANTFEPNLATTRGMIITLFYRLEGSPKVVHGQYYSDVVAGQWFTDAVIWGTQNGIIKGYDDGTYKPDQIITREQIAAIFYRYAQYKGYDVSARADLTVCSDYNKISAWALDNVSWAVATELMVGMCDGQKQLAPTDDTTRAQLATLLKRTCTKYGIQP